MTLEYLLEINTSREPCGGLVFVRCCYWSLGLDIAQTQDDHGPARDCEARG